MRATLQVVMLNLQHAAYQSTPGAPIKDYGPQGKGPMGEYLRPTTEAEAEKRRPDFERLSAELRERDPGTYEAWLADFEFWRAGDLNVRMPRVDAYEKRDEDDLRIFRDHRLVNTRESAPSGRTESRSPKRRAISTAPTTNAQVHSAMGTAPPPIPGSTGFPAGSSASCAQRRTTARPLLTMQPQVPPYPRFFPPRSVMHCSTVQSTVGPGDEPCQGTATHLLIGSIRTDAGPREPFRDPVCEPCGRGYARRPALKARVVPLHVHMPESVFIEIVEGHRLVTDPAHEARCFDCDTTGNPTWFRFQTNGCPGRPESIEVLRHSRAMLQAEPDERATMSARVWWSYAVDFIHTPIEDWRVITEDLHYSAHFTFRDREYGLRHDLPGGRIGAEKLPNRGRPEPDIVNPELDGSYKQAVFHFHNLVTDSGSRYFATYTPGHADVTGREHVILYAPEGQISQVLYMPGLNPWAETAAAICDAFGPISYVVLQDRIYE
ncbi:hypothetical protein ACFQ61_08065 [Streptomyces sp. NPDC056500]|uniref:hypothetical protein n=1 Tax=Streptomyces sp. NPDC056500 TaxID=3345840 RepID=UPI0036C85B4A